MAYREFHVEPYYADPGVEIINDGVNAAAQNISTLFQSIQRREQEKNRAANSFQYALDKGSYESDQDLLHQYAKNVKDRAVSDIRKTGKISPETQQAQVDGLNWQQKSKIQFETAKQLYDRIEQRRRDDPYYNPEPDNKKLDESAKYDHNLHTRGAIIDDVRDNLGKSDESFLYGKYRSKYVKDLGDTYKQTEYGNDNVKKTNFDEAVFWDTATGKPGVTDAHAIDYIKSEPRVDQHFNTVVQKQLKSEIDSMKASGDERVAWMKGKTDAEIQNELINDPSKNLINNKDFGVRKRELAKADLADADRVNSKVSVTYNTAKKESNSPIKNENIVHSYAFNTPKMMASGSDTPMSPYQANGAGGVLFQKNGKPIQFQSTNPVRTNVNTGLTSSSKIGSVPFNLTSYQLNPFQSTGAPFLLKGNTHDEQLAEINSIPYEYFSPTGKYKLKPQMGMALNGYTINQANILNAANNDIQTIASKLAEAEKNGDAQAVANLTTQMSRIQGLKQLVGTGVDDQELMLAASRAGVRGVQVNEMVEANDNDLANLNAITGGFNLRDKSNWSPEMKSLDAAYAKRAQEAAAAGYKTTSAKSIKKKAKFPLPAGQARVVQQNGVTYTYDEETGEYK